MQKLHTIALCGLAGSGKDTVADLLCTHAGFRRLAFADTLRAEVADAFGLDPVYLTARATKDTPMPALALARAPLTFRNAVLTNAMASGETFHPLQPAIDAPRSPRQIMQWWGTEYRRAADPDYWVQQMRNRVNYLRARLGEHRIVITDLRFPNEADYIRTTAGAQIWRITRPGIDTPAASGEGTHPSAAHVNGFQPDTTIHNCHTIGHLQCQVLEEFAALDLAIDRARISIAPDDAATNPTTERRFVDSRVNAF